MQSVILPSGRGFSYFGNILKYLMNRPHKIRKKDWDHLWLVVILFTQRIRWTI